MSTTRLALLCLVFSLTPLHAQESNPTYRFKVGSGGVSEHQFKVYLKRHANKLRKSTSMLTDAERASVRAKAIDDERLFQAALSSGLHKSPEIRRRIVALYKSKNTVARIDPRSFKTKDLLTYYNAHKSEFMSPSEVKIWAVQHSASTPRNERLATVSKAMRNPKSIKNWRNLGWKQAGDGMRTPLSKRDLDRIYRTRKGQVCGGFRGSMTDTYVFWIKDRREPKLIPFVQARSKVVNRMIQSSKQRLTEQLTKKLRSQGKAKNTEDLMFDAALESGTHKEWHTRQRIINTYIANSRMQREDLLPGLRRRYPVSPPR